MLPGKSGGSEVMTGLKVSTALRWQLTWPRELHTLIILVNMAIRQRIRNGTLFSWIEMYTYQMLLMPDDSSV